jgi:dihydrofolate reductase
MAVKKRKTPRKLAAKTRATLLLSTAVSVDGFIAAADGSFDWLEAFATPDDLEEFFAKVPVFIMGRTTYDQVRAFPSWPYEGKRVIVLTHRRLDRAPEGVEARSGPPAPIVKELKRATKGIIWHLGGGRSAKDYLDEGLVDELQLDVIPITLGRGIPLFRPDAKPLRLSLIETRSFKSGIVRLRYKLA